MVLVIGLLIALFLACCFAAVGEIILGRASADVFSANQSFILGATFAATLFFPASLLFRQYALATVLAGLCASGAYGILIRLPRLRGIQHPSIAAWWRRQSVTSAAAVLTLLACVFYFCAHNLVNSPGSDGLHIWVRRAAMLFHAGALTRDSWPGAGYDLRILDYPPLIPLVEALSAQLFGHFDFQNCKPVFCLFYCSLLLSLYSGARMLTNRTVALVMTAATAILPGVTAAYDWIGYADMPLASVVAAVAAEALKRGMDRWSFRDPLPWLAAGLLTVKSEGMILLASALASSALALLVYRGRLGVRYVHGLWKPALVLSGCLALRVAYVRWAGVADPTYGPLDWIHLSRAVFLWADIPALCIPKLLDAGTWGLLWIAFLPSAAIVTWKGSARERMLAVAAMGALISYTAIFYFTNWDFVEHIDKSYERLLRHIAPVASLVVLSAWNLLGKRSGTSVTPGREERATARPAC